MFTYTIANNNVKNIILFFQAYVNELYIQRSISLIVLTLLQVTLYQSNKHKMEIFLSNFPLPMPMVQFPLHSFSYCFEEKSWKATTGPSSIVVAPPLFVLQIPVWILTRQDCSRQIFFGWVTEEEKERRSAWLGGGSRPGHLLLAREDLTLSSSSWAGASGSP